MGKEHVVVDVILPASRARPSHGPGRRHRGCGVGAGGGRTRQCLVAALDADAANLFVTLSARSFGPQLFIVARVRVEENEEKLRRAGADRIINPQSIGGARAAAFLLQPHVTEFLDVVMHDRDMSSGSKR